MYNQKNLLNSSQQPFHKPNMTIAGQRQSQGSKISNNNVSTSQLDNGNAQAASTGSIDDQNAAQQDNDSASNITLSDKKAIGRSVGKHLHLLKAMAASKARITINHNDRAY